jgi:UDP-N-acetyl-D-glucosamine dehydrogenase
MPRYVVAKVAEALNRDRKPVNGSRILVLGVSYKPDVDDTRESPALDILELLRGMGAAVEYHDPFVPALTLESGGLESIELTAETLAGCDAVVITADHRNVDYDLVLEHARIVVDPRDGLRGRSGKAAIYPIAGPPRNGELQAHETTEQPVRNPAAGISP